MTNLEPPVLEPMLEPAPSELTIQEVVIGEGAEAPAKTLKEKRADKQAKAADKR